MVLSRAQRGELWQDDMIMQWVCVHTNARQFKTLKMVLLELRTQAGFDLEFVLLAGGETAPSVAEERARDDDQPPHLVLSDAMWTFDLFNEAGKLRTIPRFRRWKPSPRGDERAIDRIRNGDLLAPNVLSLLYPQGAQLAQSSLAEGPVEEGSLQRLLFCLQAGESSQGCVNNKHPKEAKLQYIPASNTTWASGTPSSTQVRRLIRETPQEDRLEAITGIALDAKQLLEFLNSSRLARRTLLGL